MRDLADLPKAHLHLHLDGAMRRATYAELAAERGLEAPLPTSFGSFDAFGETRLATSGVCLNVCPTSNVLLAVAPSFELHPLPALLASGVRCSLNADDPLPFGVSILDEYERCRSRMGLNDAQLADIARASLLASAAPRDLVRQNLEAVDAWLMTPAGAHPTKRLPLGD